MGKGYSGYKTMFRLVGEDGGVVSTAKFGNYSDDYEKGRNIAREEIAGMKERWEATGIFANERLHIEEV